MDPEDQSSQVNKRRLLVLVVDDNEQNRDLMAAMMKAKP